jgi:hypothetical protein
VHSTNLVARAALVAGLALGLVPVVGLAPAYACSCAAASEAEHFRDADAVFTGTLPGLPPSEASGGGRITITYDVTRVYKGEVAHLQQVATESQGTACGVNLTGGPYLVFAHARKDRGGQHVLLTTSSCGGTRDLGPNEQVPFGRGYQPVEESAAAGGKGGEGGQPGKDSSAEAAVFELLADLLGGISPAVGHVLGGALAAAGLESAGT